MVAGKGAEDSPIGFLTGVSVNGLVDQAPASAHSCELFCRCPDPCWVSTDSYERRRPHHASLNHYQDARLIGPLEGSSRSFPHPSHFGHSNRNPLNKTPASSWNHKVSPTQRKMEGRQSSGNWD